MENFVQVTQGSASFKERRRLALLALDICNFDEAMEIIRQWFLDYDIALPANDQALLIAVHKERLKLDDIDDEAKDRSRQWLALYE